MSPEHLSLSDRFAYCNNHLQPILWGCIDLEQVEEEKETGWPTYTQKVAVKIVLAWCNLW